MFTADDIQRRIRSQPFHPVRIVTSSGQSYDVTHPDLIMFNRRYLLIGTAANDNPSHFEGENRVAVLHITDLQDLPAAKSVSGNGSQ
jgi:hypothetical protein